jgi:hypothetical protein
MDVEPEAPPEPPTQSQPTPKHGASLADVPEPQEVYQDQWALYDFNENSAIELRFGEEDTLDLFINMDNIHLRNEIIRRRNVEPELLKYWFKYGLYLLSLGMLYRQRQEKKNTPEQVANGDDIDTEDFSTIARACQGLSVTIIPVISQLGQGKLFKKV